MVRDNRETLQDKIATALSNDHAVENEELREWLADVIELERELGIAKRRLARVKTFLQAVSSKIESVFREVESYEE